MRERETGKTNNRDIRYTRLDVYNCLEEIKAPFKPHLQNLPDVIPQQKHYDTELPYIDRVCRTRILGQTVESKIPWHVSGWTVAYICLTQAVILEPWRGGPANRLHS